MQQMQMRANGAELDINAALVAAAAAGASAAPFANMNMGAALMQ